MITLWSWVQSKSATRGGDRRPPEGIFYTTAEISADLFFSHLTKIYPKIFTDLFSLQAFTLKITLNNSPFLPLRSTASFGSATRDDFPLRPLGTPLVENEVRICYHIAFGTVILLAALLYKHYYYTFMTNRQGAQLKQKSQRLLFTIGIWTPSLCLHCPIR